MPPSLNPLLLNFPDQFETDRLLIRAPRESDALAVTEAMRESYDALRRWMTWARPYPKVAETGANLRQAVAKWLLREDLRLMLFHRQTGVFIGSSGLHHPDWSIPQFEIGYWLRTSVHHQGYMTEAVRGITHFALTELGAERIEIRVDTRNRPSMAVAERAGFTREGILRRDRRGVNGELVDTALYAWIRGDVPEHKENERATNS